MPSPLTGFRTASALSTNRFQAPSCTAPQLRFGTGPTNTNETQTNQSEAKQNKLKDAFTKRWKVTKISIRQAFKWKKGPDEKRSLMPFKSLRRDLATSCVLSLLPPHLLIIPFWIGTGMLLRGGKTFLKGMFKPDAVIQQAQEAKAHAQKS